MTPFVAVPPAPHALGLPVLVLDIVYVLSGQAAVVGIGQSTFAPITAW
jgi:hypothetical protein